MNFTIYKNLTINRINKQIEERKIANFKRSKSYRFYIILNRKHSLIIFKTIAVINFLVLRYFY